MTKLFNLMVGQLWKVDSQMKRSMFFFLRPGSGRKLKIALSLYRHVWATVSSVTVGAALSIVLGWAIFYADTNRGPRLAIYMGYNMAVSLAVLVVVYPLLWQWAKRTVKAGLQGDIACFPDTGAFTALYSLMARQGMGEEHMTMMKTWLTTTRFDALHRLSREVRRTDRNGAPVVEILMRTVACFRDTYLTDNQPDQEQPA